MVLDGLNFLYRSPQFPTHGVNTYTLYYTYTEDRCLNSCPPCYTRTHIAVDTILLVENYSPHQSHQPPSDGCSTRVGGLHLLRGGSTAQTPPLSIPVLFLPSIPSHPLRWTLWTSTRIAYASSNGYYGPTGTVLPPNLIRHGPAIHHVQSTIYRIPMELASWKHAYLRSPVKHSSRRARQHSFWSRLPSRWSWGHGSRRIHVGPGISGRFYDFNTHRPAWTSLRTHSRGGPGHGHTLC